MEKMQDEFECWFRNLTKVLGVVFGLLGAISIFVPITDLATSVQARCLIMIAIVVGVLLVSIVMSLMDIRRRSNTLYESEHAKIIFEYADIRKILQRTEDICVVVPVNTALDTVFDKEAVSKNTIHRECLDYLSELTKLDSKLLTSIKVKKGSFENGRGEVGDWFLLTPSDLGIEDNVRFLFLEIFNKEEKNGKLVNAELGKEDYLLGMQSLIEGISDVLDQQEKVYIPLIGSGAGKVGSPKDIMVFMKELLRFNKTSLHQEVHVVVNEKQKNDVPIYELRKFQ